MNAVVYADFTCPACYLASLRVDRLLATGQPVPDWRAVEHRPRLPLTGLRLDGAAQRTRNAELDSVRAVLRADELLPEDAPSRLPHTASAIAAYAEAYEAGVADLVRPLLFRAYWVEDLDIGDPELLRRLLPDALGQGRRTADPIKDFGYAVTSQHAPVTHMAYTRIRQWQRDWLALAGPVALTLVTDTRTLIGEQALAHLPTAPATAAPTGSNPPRRRIPFMARQP